MLWYSFTDVLGGLGEGALTVLTPDWLRLIAYLLFASSLIPAALAVQQFLRSRGAKYYVMRQNAHQRFVRWMFVALTMEVLAVAVLITAPRLPPIELAPTAAPIVTVSPSPTSRPTRTPTPTLTRPPTATPPFIPTPTPDTPSPDPAVSPLPSDVPAGEDARITFITLAADKDENGQPVDPGTEFPPGDHRVYLFIAYEGMTNGLAWTFDIYRGEEHLDGLTQAWEWGEQGETYLYYKPPGGYEPGIYQMRVLIEDRVQGVAQFVITEE